MESRGHRHLRHQPDHPAVVRGTDPSNHDVLDAVSDHVVFVDSSRTVQKIVEELAPWRMAGALFASTAIEFPAGTLKQGGLQVGVRLFLAPEPGRRPLWAA